MSSSWKLKFNANNSLIHVSIGFFDGFEILGASFPLGVRVGVESWTSGFMIKLPSGCDTGIVVVRAFNRGGTGRETKVIHVIRKNQRRVTAYEDPLDPADMVGTRHLFHVYDTHAEVDVGSDVISSYAGPLPANARRADMSSILSYVAGSISRQQLLQAATRQRRQERTEEEAKRLRDENARLRRLLNQAQIEVEASTASLDELSQRLSDKTVA